MSANRSEASLALTSVGEYSSAGISMFKSGGLLRYSDWLLGLLLGGLPSGLSQKPGWYSRGLEGKESCIGSVSLTVGVVVSKCVSIVGGVGATAGLLTTLGLYNGFFTVKSSLCARECIASLRGLPRHLLSLLFLRGGGGGAAESMAFFWGLAGL